MMEKWLVYSKKYRIIAISVQITDFTPRYNGGAARQGRSPQLATAYSPVH